MGGRFSRKAFMPSAPSLSKSEPNSSDSRAQPLSKSRITLWRATCLTSRTACGPLEAIVLADL